ncbi:MAG: carbohydrate ABC transporter permease [Lachnospiraceae bacterium]|nr:carbohydrate ABC transporter permease [Lachnospiraceae bacterium]
MKKKKTQIKTKKNAKYYKKMVARIIVYFILTVVGFVYLEPILEMLAKTLMSAEDVIDPSVTWIPKKPSLENLSFAATVLKLGTTLKNSILFAGALAIGQTFVASLTGFALSRYAFKGRKFFFAMLILAFIIPVPVLMVPRMMMFVVAQESLKFQLIGTVWPQLLMAFFGQGVYSTVLVLIFYTAFNMIPRVLDEAAEIDGASALKVYWFIVIKMSATTILVVFLFSFVWNWNETYITSTLLRGNLELLPSKLTLFNSEFDSVSKAVGGAFKLNEAFKMSATLISISPLLLLYAFVQKWFIQGIENTGITGE